MVLRGGGGASHPWPALKLERTGDLSPFLNNLSISYRIFIKEIKRRNFLDFIKKNP